MIRILIIIFAILFIYLFLRKKYLLKSIVETLKINRLLRLNLLKILSRVTSPTTGNIKTKGRIASLLEVGTGFHGEMTGRENIYLNGAILG